MDWLALTLQLHVHTRSLVTHICVNRLVIFQVLKYTTNKTVVIESKLRPDGKMAVNIKDQQTGTIISITNPYGYVTY